MKEIHDELVKKSHVYRTWHELRVASLFHFLILTIVATFATSLIIDRSSYEFEFSVGKASAANKLESIPGLTKDLLDISDLISKNRKEFTGEALELAQTRKELMLVAFETDPNLFLNNSISDKHREKLPTEIKALVEEAVTISGKAQVIYSEGISGQSIEAGRSELTYTLLANGGEKVKLNFKSNNPNILTDDTLRLRGYKLDSNLVVTSVESQTSGAQSLTQNKRVAVILMNFFNNTSQPYSQDIARQVTFTAANSVSAYYAEQSFGQIGLTGSLRPDGDIFGWYTIPVNNTPCDTSGWATAAKSAAAADGFIQNNYDVIIYGFPQTSACSWWGLGTVGGTLAQSWVNGSYQLRVAGHEFGHNLGRSHASSYACTDTSGAPVVLSPTCTTSEYGDPFDIMGASTNHFNIYFKGRYINTTPTWLTSSNTLTVTVDGNYPLMPIEKYSSGVQSIRVPRTYTNGVPSQYYYLEYRQPTGFDSNLTSTAARGVTFHLGPDYALGGRSLFLDMTPSTSAVSDGVLLPGQTYIDNERGVQFTLTSATSTEAVVNVHFGTPQCINVNPTLTISPSTQSGFGGQTLAYTVSVKNNDSSSCSGSQFQVTSTLPSGWIQTPETFTTAILAPGLTTNTVVNITSVSGTSPSNYTFIETAKNTSNLSLTSANSAAYVVSNQDSTPPVVSITKPANGAKIPAKGKMQISATASDSSGLQGIVLNLNGVTQKTCLNTLTCSANITVNSIPVGNHTVSATAIDKAGNTASTSISVVK